MPRPQIVWLRRDLRVHDHPGLHEAVAAGGAVVPVFVVDPTLTAGPAASGPRASFLAATLADLDAALRERGNRLVVVHGDPAAELGRLARQVDAAVVRWTADAAPFGRRRDERVRRALEADGRKTIADPGQYVVEPTALQTQGGRPYTVFGPYRRRWQDAARRTIHRAPRRIEAVSGVGGESLPGADDLGRAKRRPDVPEPIATGGETTGLAAARRWLDGPIARYADRHDRLAGGTSELSPHLRWGTISARWLEARARVLGGEGPAAFVRQLAWRDFFAHVYRHHPDDRHREHQERYRDLHWEDDPEGLDAWREGRTGFPLVDAGMRQLAATGWIHNRARMVVGSFLTKDLHVDWRHGESHFLGLLLDGEPVQNDGNWQWIASVGVDPKPYFQRLFNPTRQQQRFDPGGAYVRRWVPELAAVPDQLLAEPWRMSADQQRDAGCAIGDDYPAPIVDHAEQREIAAARYREAGER
jgi:deoxyribodipyrimidine photo-lyase